MVSPANMRIHKQFCKWTLLAADTGDRVIVTDTGDDKGGRQLEIQAAL